MKTRDVLCLVSRVALTVLLAPSLEAATYDLYYLGGQSNMDGYGRVEELPEDLEGPVDGVMIYHGNTSADATPVDGRGMWTQLRPGHGVGYESDGETAVHSDRWHCDSAGYIDLGSEFAAAIRQLQVEGPVAVADPDPLRFQPQIADFAEWDRKSSFPKRPVLFVGSSSIRLWSTAASFPGCGILNRGFGGAQISDVQHYYEDVVAGYRPRSILFYAGDNDVWDGKSPARVFHDFRAFVETVRADNPGTPVFFIAIKPSVRRWHSWRDMEEVNGLVQAWSESQPDVVYVDVATPMLGEDGTPRADLFEEDDLHLNEAGYDLWGSTLGPHLESMCRARGVE